MNITDFNNFISEYSGMPFLLAPNGYWINNEDKLINFNSMEDEYVTNCYNWALRWEKGKTISGCMTSNPELSSFTNSDKNLLFEYMTDLANDKKNDLILEMKKRKLG